uniref:Uncharacterized protein n=1 Tax=Molossus molossus TaxID=27622 RepID=A0A7J8E305_MOLMO|nr:hypothetical protein HJG59_009079 [Molossus molossus]
MFTDIMPKSRETKENNSYMGLHQTENLPHSKRNNQNGKGTHFPKYIQYSNNSTKGRQMSNSKWAELPAKPSAGAAQTHGDQGTLLEGAATPSVSCYHGSVLGLLLSAKPSAGATAASALGRKERSQVKSPRRLHDAESRQRLNRQQPVTLGFGRGTADWTRTVWDTQVLEGAKSFR